MTPANSFTPHYVQSLCETMDYCFHNSIQLSFHNHSGSHVGQLRELMVEQIRIQKIKYDCMLWIDSDISWTAADFEKLITSPHPVTMGSYMVSPDGMLSLISKELIDGVKKYPIYYHKNDIASLDRYVEVHCGGFGFVAIKRGVFEMMDSPYFSNIIRVNPFTNAEELETSEDAAWCLRAQKAGFKIMSDTTVNVAHVKTNVWR